MKQDYRHAFLLGLERGVFTLPQKMASCHVYHAVVLPDLEQEIVSTLICEQAFRPEFLHLERAGYSTLPLLDQTPCDAAIVFAGRNRKVNEANIIRAWNACDEGGSIIIAGDKTAGIAALRKWVSAKTEIIESFSKFHALVFEIVKSGENWLVPDLFKTIDDYHLAEGMFSADGPDLGSRLLVEHFDKRIGGRVADFGTGWGYLSAELCKRSQRIASIELYEADWHSLEAARKNLSGVDVEASFHWCDLQSEYKKHVLDWVIMNPPFHAGRNAEPKIGQTFIATAASTLPSGGRLLMVANRNLPYEQTLERLFKGYEVLETRDGFKIIEARK